MRWDFDNMTIDELIDDAQETIERYNSIILMIGAKSLYKSAEKELSRREQNDEETA